SASLGLAHKNRRPTSGHSYKKCANFVEYLALRTGSMCGVWSVFTYDLSMLAGVSAAASVKARIVDGASLVSVVVVGAMNPAIHYPKWYSTGDPELADDTQAALAGLIMIPQLTQFQAPRFAVRCSPDKWIISTPDVGWHGRILEIACTTFDRLGQTPVRTFGVNYDFVGQLKVPRQDLDQTVSYLACAENTQMRLQR